MAPIKVVLRPLVGEPLELDVKSVGTVDDLKTILAGEWGVPKSYQRLVIGAADLVDAQRLAVQCPPGTDSVSVAGLVSLDTAARDLGHCRGDFRATALRFLGGQGPQGPEAGVDKVRTGLADQDAFVRLAAVESMAKIAANGDEITISAVLRHLFAFEQDESVRRAAALALLEDEGTRLFLVAAVETLAQMAAKKADDRAVVAVIARTEDRVDSVRRAALEALAQVAEQGDERAVAAALARMEDKSRWVRRAGVVTLAQVAAKGDMRAIAAVSARLQDEFPCVRCAAVDAMVAFRGEAVAIAVVVARLEHVDPSVRRAAVEALAQVAEPGDERAIAAVRARLEDEDHHVRRAAVEAMAQVEKGGAEASCKRRRLEASGC